MKPSTLVAPALGGIMLAISVAGCAATGSVAPEATNISPPATASTATDTPATNNPSAGVAAKHNTADVPFAHMMTIHHQGALEMSQLASQRATSSDVQDVAATIEAAQLPEIQLMESWVTAWDEPLQPRDHAGMDHGGMDMNGMSQEQVMTELQQVTGADFDNQFSWP